MSTLVASLAWCWIQVLLVAGAASGLSLLALRRSPAAGATIAWWGIVATLALTGLAIVPFPRRAAPLVLRWLDFKRTPNEQVVSFKTPPIAAPAAETNEEPGFHAALDGPLLAGLLHSLRNSESVVVRHHSAARVLVVILALGSSIGLARLIRGLLDVAALRRRSTLVADEHVLKLTAELLPSLQLNPAYMAVLEQQAANEGISVAQLLAQ